MSLSRQNQPESEKKKIILKKWSSCTFTPSAIFHKDCISFQGHRVESGLKYRFSLHVASNYYFLHICKNFSCLLFQTHSHLFLGNCLFFLPSVLSFIGLIPLFPSDTSVYVRRNLLDRIFTSHESEWIYWYIRKDMLLLVIPSPFFCSNRMPNFSLS